MSLAQAIADKVKGTVDKWGNIKVEKDGKTYRYAIKKQVVRYEVQVVHADRTKAGVRLKSYNLKSLAKKLLESNKE